MSPNLPELMNSAGAALGADLEHGAGHEAGLALGVHGVLQHVGGIHVLGEGLLAVGVLAGDDGVAGVLRVLEVSRGDDHGIDVLRLLVERHVARIGGD